ncbi:hypothetical protein LCGC14_1509520 [marine sediment metagenome]|uniref:Uncharacterized protein n=1 Tax=marine sediment metagenome TaxID=412755 RepID=A0A0F9JMJ2_9ZZZZ
MREKLAALEHEQWAHWTRYMLDNLTFDNIKRWKVQIDTPYSELTEKEKDSDRIWADKVLDLPAKELAPCEGCKPNQTGYPCWKDGGNCNLTLTLKEVLDGSK